MMTDEYDLIVIGAGSAGVSAAPFAARLGATVALVERYLPGGDCLYTGCVPSKTLIKSAKVAWEMRRAADYGLTPADTVVDLGRVMAHVQDVIRRVYQFESPDALAEDGVEVVLEAARFVDPHTIAAGERRLRAKYFLLCTGARATLPPVSGLTETPYESYETVFNMKRLPARLLVLGAGPIGLELAQAFQRLGSQVTVFQRSKHILTFADPEISMALIDVLAQEGIQFRTGSQIERVASTSSGGVSVTVDGESVEGDALLVATGRQPNVEQLGLDKAGVETTEKGVPVDERLRTNQKHIYACGDVIGSHQFTHYAGWQAYLAVRNALLPGSSSGVRDQVPWTIFTDPEVARCGMTEQEARERHGDDVRVATWPLERLDRAQTEEDRQGFIKVVHKRGGEILGAHIMAARAGEMISEYVLAMEKDLNFGDLSGAVHVYPTYSTGNQQIAAVYRVNGLLESRSGKLVTGLAKWIR
jgi:pyruvate/2-oxoglutarate dehydrogenase complex dihydrolipoamide dehydrogenase (E3) component